MMTNTTQQLLAVLFAGARPFTVRRLGELCGVTTKDVEASLEELEGWFGTSSLMLQVSGNEVQVVTRPAHAEVVKQVVRDEVSGELSRPSLETLTILAYRGPLTRAELEQVRGVHSSVILRNLMLRGLVVEKEDARLGQPTYAVTFEFIQHLGLQSLEELPDYVALRGHEHVLDVLAELDAEETADAEGASSDVARHDAEAPMDLDAADEGEGGEEEEEHDEEDDDEEDEEDEKNAGSDDDDD